EAAIPAEQLVASGARERDRKAGLADRAADEVRVDPVEGRLVEAPKRVGKLPLEGLPCKPKLMVLGAERRRDGARVARLVIEALVETDVEGADPRVPRAHRECCDGAR